MEGLFISKGHVHVFDHESIRNLFCSCYSSRKSARKAHMHHLPFVTHIQFRDIKLCWMTQFADILELARCTDVHAPQRARTARAGIREIGQESVRTVWPCFRLCNSTYRGGKRKKRMNADKKQGGAIGRDRLRKTETGGGTVSGWQIRTFPRYMRRKF